MHGSGAVSCSCSLLIRGPNLARCQAKAPLIALCRFSKPALFSLAQTKKSTTNGRTGLKAGASSGHVAAPLGHERSPRHHIAREWYTEERLREPCQAAAAI